jgi:AAA+ superfamily predicted ATPase
MANEVATLTEAFKARASCIWIKTIEEGRVNNELFDIASRNNMLTRVWNVVAGVTDINGKPYGPNRDPYLQLRGGIGGSNPALVLNFITAQSKIERGENGNESAAEKEALEEGKKRAVWIFNDFHPYLRQPDVCRWVRNCAKFLPSTPNSESRIIVVVAPPSAQIPDELIDHVTVVKWSLPDRKELGRIFDTSLIGVPPEIANQSKAVKDEAIEAAVGLSAEAAALTYAKSIVTERRINPIRVAFEKKAVISKERGIEWFDPLPGGLDDVGGHENTKAWLKVRRRAFSQAARDFGLPLPKGLCLVGCPGCGKSLLAKAIATAWGVPLLRFDPNATASKWVGESEANIRAVLAVAEAVGRCVLWIDEIEKAFGGATNGGADGGVSTDRLGVMLSWMQERKGEVFVVATANDVTKLPPELLRKGRFDEIFFVDLPNTSERKEIVAVALKQHKRVATVDNGCDPSVIDLDAVAAVTAEFTGVEVASLVPEALHFAFDEGRTITTADLLEAAKTVPPLSKTSPERINAVRKWARESQARFSSSPEVTTNDSVAKATVSRSIDL